MIFYLFPSLSWARTGTGNLTFSLIPSSWVSIWCTWGYQPPAFHYPFLRWPYDRWWGNEFSLSVRAGLRGGAAATLSTPVFFFHRRSDTRTFSSSSLSWCSSCRLKDRILFCISSGMETDHVCSRIQAIFSVVKVTGGVNAVSVWKRGVLTFSGFWMYRTSYLKRNRS